MLKKRRLRASILLILLLAVSAIGFSWQSERTPEYAMKQLMEGMRTRNPRQVELYADVHSLIETSYDAGTNLLAERIQDLQREYPQDWFFRHDTAFMRNYIANRRDEDILFIHQILVFYMDPDMTPISRMDGQARWAADEIEQFEKNYTVRLGEVRRHGTEATAALDIRGRDTDYGRLVSQLTVKIRLRQQEDGHWQVVSVDNVDELFAPVVRGVEDYWTLQGWQ